MEPETLILGLGILLGLVYTHRTGWGCGGILTPGLLALHASQPSRLAAALGIGVLLALPLALGVRRFGLYGRERLGAALLLALAVRALVEVRFPLGSLWLGWVVPGLVAAEVQRQGVLPTLAGACSAGAAAALAARLLLG